MSVESPDGSGTFQQRVNRRLEEANGNGKQSQGQSAEPDKSEVPSSDQMARMRKRFENMSAEDRQKEMEKIKKQMENMSQEERDAMRKRFQGAGGSRQRGGQRQGGGGQGTRGAERNQ
jgi:hypothetical protein